MRIDKPYSKWAISLGIKLFIFSLPFTQLLELPILKEKCQISEFVFLVLLLPTALLEFFKKGIRLQSLISYNYLPVILILSTIPSLIFSWSTNAFFDFAGLIYLLVLYFTFLYLLPIIKNWERFLIHLIQTLGLICICTIAYSYFSIIWPQLPGSELYETKYIPLLGWTYRIKGFTSSPNMLASVMVLPVLLQWYLLLTSSKKSQNWMYTILFSLGVLATGSKSLVLVMAGILWIIHQFLNKTTAIKYLSRMGMIACLLIYLFTTNFLMSTNKNLTRSLQDQNYTSGHIVWQRDNIAIYETTHFKLKEIAWKAFKENPILGIGLGNFQKYLSQQQKSGFYPSDRPIYQPHSTYMKFLAEIGITGFILWLGLIYHTLSQSYKGFTLFQEKIEILTPFLFISFCVWFIDATAIDMLSTL